MGSRFSRICSLGLLVTTTVLLSACGGGGSGNLPATTSGSAQSKSSHALFVIKTSAPKSTTSSTSRQPEYLSPSTQSVVITANNGAKTIVNLTTTSPNCAFAANAATCSVSLTVPVGINSFTLTAYDGQNGTGNALSTNSLANITIPAAGATIPLTQYGIVAQAVVTSAAPVIDCHSSNISIGVSLEDADGNIIFGPAAYQNGPFTLTDSDGSGATTLSTPSIAKPSDVNNLVVNYSGGLIANPIISVTGTGLTAGNVKSTRLFGTLVSSRFSAATGGSYSGALISGEAGAFTLTVPETAFGTDTTAVASQIAKDSCASSFGLPTGGAFVQAFSLDTGGASISKPLSIAGSNYSAIGTDPIGTVYRLALFKNGALTDVANASATSGSGFNLVPPTPSYPGITTDGLYVLYKPQSSAATGAVAYAEPFTGNEVPLSLWQISGDTCLTAGDVGTTTASIPACPASLDPLGSGVLRLNAEGNFVGGIAVYKVPIAYSGSPLSISFDYFAYNGTGADGLSVFLSDGTQPIPSVTGSLGGFLGYSGLAGGYLGVGFDSYGNYAGHEQSIGVRGAQATGYAVIDSLTTPLAFRLDSLTPIRPSPLTIKVTFDPAASTITASIDQHDGNGPVKYINAQSYNVANQPAAPPSVYIGFAAATGSVTDFHEIRNLVISK